LLSLMKTLPIEEPLRDAGFTPTLQLEKGTLFNR